MSAPFRPVPLLLLLAATGMASAEIVVEDRPLSSAPVMKTTTPVTPVAPVTAVTGKAVANDNTVVNEPASSGTAGSNWELYTQVQQLQQEVAGLRGTLEEQSHLIEKLQSDLRARYTDLDQRLVAQQDQMKQAAPVAAVATGNETAAPSATIEEEKKAYLAAYDTYRAGGPGKAIPPMLAFVKRYPNSTFTPNAYYWLGEFYLNTDTPDQAAALKHFETVGKYPDNAKAPAALYKIGSILDLQGKPLEAKKKMQELLTKYPKSPEAGLAENYLKALEAAQAAAAKPAAKAPGKTESKPAAIKKTGKKT
ncbi:MAG: tol-pal system protein YbgF [bacterium]|nr:tol-pal system protein YbgF [bacterium]